jgi:predicted transcriptional regulator of viral defense system
LERKPVSKSLNKIEDFFQNLSKFKKKSFSKHELMEIFRENIDNWELKENSRFDNFLRILKRRKILIESIIKKDDKEKIIYSYKYPTIFEVAMSIEKNSYLSHYSAVFINQLTEQIPKTIYVNKERGFNNKENDEKIDDEKVKNAFNKEPRVSKNIYTFDDKKIVLLNCMDTNKIGVRYVKYENSMIETTNLERTLIDCVVRPFYVGGIEEVIKYFINAKNLVSINLIIEYLNKIDYIYPYHQAVGFYLDIASYSEKNIEKLKKINIYNDFYLTNFKSESELAYVKKWKIYVPKYLV